MESSTILSKESMQSIKKVRFDGYNDVCPHKCKKKCEHKKDEYINFKVYLKSKSFILSDNLMMVLETTRSLVPSNR